MTQVSISKDGSVRVLDEKNKEYVRVLLHIKEDDTLEVQCTVKNKYLYANKLYPKPPLNMRAIRDIVEEDLYVDKDLVDIARTTPEFAHHYNEVVNTFFDEQDEVSTEMSSYRDGYSFVGEAFVNFVSALLVYHAFPEEDTKSLHDKVTLLRSNFHLASVSMDTGWSRYLASPKCSQSHTVQRRRMMASSFKGLVGSLYEANGITKLREVFQFVKNTIAPNMVPELFEPDTSMKQPMIYMGLVLFSTLLGWFSCYMSLTMYQKTHTPFHINEHAYLYYLNSHP